MILRVDGIPPSLNEFMRMDRYARNRAVKEWKETVALSALEQGLRNGIHGRASVTLEYHFRNKNRRDPDNYAGKFLLDGLTAAGLIEDDDFVHVDLHLRKGATDPLTPHVVIYIEPATEEGIA